MKNVVLKLVVCFVLSFCTAGAASAQPVQKEQDFSLPDLHGSTVSLASVLEKKQPVLLFFWTTWCPFCLKEIKQIDKRAEAFGDKLTVLAINAGEEKPKVERLVKNYSVKTIVLLDPGQTAVEAYHVLGVPTFVLFNGNGGIVFNDNYFPEKEIRGLLGKQ